MRHYEYILNATSKYRDIQTHCYKGYCGPWIEEVFISQLSHLPYQSFGPFIPLFINWLGIFKGQYFQSDYEHSIADIFSLLDERFLYITVVMHDGGIEGYDDLFPIIPPNLIIISSGGSGHIPAFFLFRQLDPITVKSTNYDIAFMGTVGNRHRKICVKTLEKVIGKRFFYNNTFGDWKETLAQSKVCLAPRGYGVGCFRNSEILQLGLIPFFTYDEYLWLPYVGSSFPWDEISFIANESTLEGTARQILQLNDKKVNQMRMKIATFRDSHFTMKGMIRQISEFLRRGYERSDLRCTQFHSWRPPSDN